MSTKHSHAKHTHAADVAKTAEEVTAQAGNKLKAALENTKQFVGNVRDKTVATAKATDKAVKGHPYKFVAVATGLGLALGYIFGRRRCRTEE
jgi:ElaB/YqjD/DUF883 family membrane-anchored ribosome-binding protein